ncbi:hypothetical protein QUF80_07000 [Desulfococcaceae bacterium HSG8]|nr:hypothetical protein [Desulfococcaceae bacterium HSG8]
MFGGSKYKKELAKAKKYHRIIGQFRRAGRVVEVDGKEVDKEQRKIQDNFSHPDFDDPHLVAIVIVSKVRLVCTNEKRACPFLKKPGLYPKGIERPKIYSGTRNAGLLTERNIARICKTSKQVKDLSGLFGFY